MVVFILKCEYGSGSASRDKDVKTIGFSVHYLRG